MRTTRILFVAAALVTLAGCSIPAGARVGPALYTTAGGETVEQGISVVSVQTPQTSREEAMAKAAKELKEAIDAAAKQSKEAADKAVARAEAVSRQIDEVVKWSIILALGAVAVFLLRRKS